MALVNTGFQLFPIPWYNPAATGLIDAANEIVGGVFQAPKTGNIAHIHFRTATVTTGATVTVALRTVDASGNLTTTDWGTNTNNTQVINSADDNIWFRTTLTSAGAVNLGDTLGVVVKNPAASFGTINIYKSYSLSASQGFPYSVTPTESTKDDLDGCPFIFEYDDSTFYAAYGCFPFALTTLNINTGTNPDEIALYYTETAPRRVTGIWFNAGVGAGADYRTAFYADGNNTPLAVTNTIDGDYTTNAGQRLYFTTFTSTVNTVVGTVYRASILPLTATSLTIRYADCNATYPNMFAAVGLAGMSYSSRNRSSTTDPDAAAWSQDTSRYPNMGIIYDQIDNAVSAGGNRGYVIGG